MRMQSPGSISNETGAVDYELGSLWGTKAREQGVDVHSLATETPIPCESP